MVPVSCLVVASAVWSALSLVKAVPEIESFAREVVDVAGRFDLAVVPVIEEVVSGVLTA
tara:strand:+ start:1702 stop:1878 length:177 start_codon:yes stop_codon:yes gene_type:complete